MRRYIALLILAVISVVCACPSRAQTAITTNTVTINFNSFAGINASSIRSITAAPMYWASIGNVIYDSRPVTVSVATQPAMTNGSAVFSNQVCGIPYQISLNGYATLKTNYFIPSTAGTNQNVTLQTAWIGRYMDQGTFLYPNPVVTNVTISGGTGIPLAAGTNANVTLSNGTNIVSVPTATTNVAGVVKPDNTTITISNGTLTAFNGGSGTITGGAGVGGATVTTAGTTLIVTADAAGAAASALVAAQNFAQTNNGAFATNSQSSVTAGTAAGYTGTSIVVTNKTIHNGLTIYSDNVGNWQINGPLGSSEPQFFWLDNDGTFGMIGAGGGEIQENADGSIFVQGGVSSQGQVLIDTSGNMSLQNQSTGKGIHLDATGNYVRFDAASTNSFRVAWATNSANSQTAVTASNLASWVTLTNSQFAGTNWFTYTDSNGNNVWTNTVSISWSIWNPVTGARTNSGTVSAASFSGNGSGLTFSNANLKVGSLVKYQHSQAKATFLVIQPLQHTAVSMAWTPTC